MLPDEVSPDLARELEEVSTLTPEAQTEWARQHIEDWPTFLEAIRTSREALSAWRAAGNSGFPPGWITRQEYERERALRGGL